MTSPVNEDTDVSGERRRVLRGSGKRDLIRLENLTKVMAILVFNFLYAVSYYDKVHAVVVTINFYQVPLKHFFN